MKVGAEKIDCTNIIWIGKEMGKIRFQRICYYISTAPPLLETKNTHTHTIQQITKQ